MVFKVGGIVVINCKSENYNKCTAKLLKIFDKGKENECWGLKLLSGKYKGNNISLFTRILKPLHPKMEKIRKEIQK